MNMKYTKYILVFLPALLVAGCAAQSAHRQGIAAFDRGDYVAGIANLERAVREAPDNTSYRVDLRSRKEKAVQQLIAAGDAARAGDNAEAAEAAYGQVLALEPGNARARAGLAALHADREHAEGVAKAAELLDAKEYEAADDAIRAILTDDPAYAPAVALAARLGRERGPVTAVPRLKPQGKLVSLQFRDAPTKMVFEVLARQSGINFIFDKDIKSDGKTTIFVNQVPIEQAVDLVLAQNQLARQVLSENTMLVYPGTPAKQKDYQDEIVRTFYLTSAAPKDAESMLKTVLGTKTLFVDERANVVVMRDTPEHVRMAEKLVATLDVAEAEVILEVEVLEITHSTLQQLGIAYPSSVTFTANSPSGSKNMTVNDVLNQDKNTITVSPLSVTVDALKTSGQTNVLSSPRIRARNKEKAKILIGDRVPVITSGSSATTGGTYSTSSVQYLDVGLTLDVQPTIHNDGDVAIKVALEVSRIVKEITVPIGNGGTTLAYQIGTRNANTLLELKDGETQVLAGLIQDSDRRSSTGIPGLSDLPLLGHLFGSSNTTRDKNEIVLSITPRIIRGQPRPPGENLEFWYGSESQTRSAPLTVASTTPMAAPAGPVTPGIVGVGGGSVGTTAAAPAPAARAVPEQLGATVAAAPATDAAAGAAGTTAAGTAEGAVAAGAVAGAAGAAGATAAEGGAATPPAKPEVTIEGPDSASVGQEIDVAVKVTSGQPLGRIRAQVRYDASALQLVSAEPGDLAPSGETPKVDLRSGGAQVEFAGVEANSGSMLNLRFRVVAPRPAVVTTQVVTLGADGAALGATPATSLKINATP